jgi:allantoin racemase
VRILIVNTNSDPEMTDVIERSAEAFANGEFEVVCKPTPGAPVFIETYEDILQAAPGMIQVLREHEEALDAFVIACHDDPNLDAMKEITRKPVVGIGEASMKMASAIRRGCLVALSLRSRRCTTQLSNRTAHSSPPDPPPACRTGGR